MINSTTVGSALIVLVLAAAALLAGHVWGQGHEPNRPYISPTASATSTLPSGTKPAAPSYATTAIGSWTPSTPSAA